MASEDYVSVRRLQQFYNKLQEELPIDYATKHDIAQIDLQYTADTTNGDQLQIPGGTTVNIVNAKHAASADTATQDGYGNVILSTYATKTELEIAVGNIETLLAAI